MDEWRMVAEAVTGDVIEEVEPPYEQDPSEHDVGMLVSPLARKLFTKWWQLCEAASRTMNEAQWCRDAAKRESYSYSGRRLAEEASIVHAVFFLFLKIEFADLWDKKAIGIRKGWHVTWRNATPPQMFPFPFHIKGEEQ